MHTANVYESYDLAFTTLIITGDPRIIAVVSVLPFCMLHSVSFVFLFFLSHPLSTIISLSAYCYRFFVLMFLWVMPLYRVFSVQFVLRP